MLYMQAFDGLVKEMTELMEAQFQKDSFKVPNSIKLGDSVDYAGREQSSCSNC